MHLHFETFVMAVSYFELNQGKYKCSLWRSDCLVTFRYADYREPPNVTNKYDRTAMYWYILAVRLAFVVVFEVSFRKEESDFFVTFNISSVLKLFLKTAVHTHTHATGCKTQQISSVHDR
jgi:hypothetical protein